MWGFGEAGTGSALGWSGWTARCSASAHACSTTAFRFPFHHAPLLDSGSLDLHASVTRFSGTYSPANSCESVGAAKALLRSLRTLTPQLKVDTKLIR